MTETAGSEPLEYFVVCPMEEISPGSAKAFDLLQTDGAGGSKPFRILIARDNRGKYFAYRNACPHTGVWLNIGAGTFFDDSGAHLKCGRHGALFTLENGTCHSGACEGATLERVTVAALDGDVCIAGVELVEEDFGLSHPDDMEETLEITIPQG